MRGSSGKGASIRAREYDQRMPDLSRNTLSQSSSPYLLQHQDDPVHWQEWSEDVLTEAGRLGKMIFVSIGYATCHWCHVMARESFRDPKTAELLNAHCVSIKVDREQRPDIDRYFLEYVSAKTGHGGWPMSVFLAPDRTPITGGTYFPPETGHGMLGFTDLITSLAEWQAAHPHGGLGLEAFALESSDRVLPDISLDTLRQAIASQFDRGHHGFGRDAKFPPHTTLLFLLGTLPGNVDSESEAMCRETLDTMALSGLHDHLQGGFYRYCVDPAWEIPHFEKMLYDQALHLWTYTWAWQRWKDPLHARVIAKLVQCLDETYLVDGVAIAAHDADTDHAEGATYVWAEKEIRSALSETQFAAFSQTYWLSKDGNFEGLNHLVRRTRDPLPAEEDILLERRRLRPQPFADRKIVTGWNALLGMAYLQHARICEDATSRAKAIALADELLKRNADGATLSRSSLDGVRQGDAFLEDYAALIVFLTMLFEDTRDDRWLVRAKDLRKTLLTFRVDGVWKENSPDGDFPPVTASCFDHPVPASASLAEYALQRCGHALSEDVSLLPSRQPLQSDFWNLVAYASQGGTPVIHGPELISWKELPPMPMQLPGERWEECSAGRCSMFRSADELLTSLKKLS